MRDFCIIGLGQFGKILALELIAMGHTVVGINKDPKIIDEMKDKIPDLYVLDATKPIPKPSRKSGSRTLTLSWWLSVTTSSRIS